MVMGERLYGGGGVTIFFSYQSLTVRDCPDPFWPERVSTFLPPPPPPASVVSHITLSFFQCIRWQFQHHTISMGYGHHSVCTQLSLLPGEWPLYHGWGWNLSYLLPQAEVVQHFASTGTQDKYLEQVLRTGNQNRHLEQVLRTDLSKQLVLRVSSCLGR